MRRWIAIMPAVILLAVSMASAKRDRTATPASAPASKPAPVVKVDLAVAFRRAVQARVCQQQAAIGPQQTVQAVAEAKPLKVIGRGMQTGMTHDPVLSPEQLARLTVSAEREPFDGDARLFRLVPV